MRKVTCYREAGDVVLWRYGFAGKCPHQPTLRIKIMAAKTVVMEKVKETKNTVKYSTEDDSVTDGIYIKKGAFEEGVYPSTITITINL